MGCCLHCCKKKEYEAIIEHADSVDLTPSDIIGVETNGDKSKDESNKPFPDTNGGTSKTTSQSKPSAEARSINLYRKIDGGGKKFHIQIIEDEVPTNECHDTQAVVVFRRPDGTLYDNADEKVLQEAGEDLEADYQAAKAKGGKYVRNGVILTKAGKNSGYIIHCTVDSSLFNLQAKLRDALITALQMAEKHELKSVAFPPYLCTRLGIDIFLEWITDFVRECHPICMNFVQLFLPKELFDRCQEMRKDGKVPSYTLPLSELKNNWKHIGIAVTLMSDSLYEHCGMPIDIQRSQNLRHLYSVMGLKLGSSGFSHNQITVVRQVRMSPASTAVQAWR